MSASCGAPVDDRLGTSALYHALTLTHLSVTCAYSYDDAVVGDVCLLQQVVPEKVNGNLIVPLSKTLFTISSANLYYMFYDWDGSLIT